MRLLTRSRWLGKLIARRPVTIRHAANSLRAKLGCEDLELRTTPAVTAIQVDNINPTEGVPFGTAAAPVRIGQFTINSFNFTPEPINYSATIAWGDGTITSGFGPSSDIRFVLGSNIGNGVAIYEVWSYHTYSDASPVSNPGGVNFPYTISLTIHDFQNGGTTQADSGTVVVNDAPLANGIGVPVNAVAGAPLNSVLLATFTDNNPLSTADDLTATITWGNPAEQTPGIIVKGADGTYRVLGSHTYDASAPGVSGINIAVRSVTSTLSINTTATVARAEIIPDAATVVMQEGGVLPPATYVGLFTDESGGQVVANYVVQAQFPGAAAATPITVTRLGTSNQYVLTTGAFTNFTAPPAAGAANYVLTISPLGGSVVTTSGVLLVNNAPLTMGTVNAPGGAVEGARLNNFVVATFSDANTASTGGYTAVIDWGDGSPTTLGTVVSLGGGVFRVDGSHTYTDETPAGTTYRITVSVSDVAGGSTVGQSATFSVADSTIVNSVPSSISGTDGVRLNDVLLGTFTDNNPFGRPSDFTVVLNWGDSSGTDTVGTVRLVGGTQTTATFAVYGSHSYAAAGLYNVTATITDAGAPGNLVINTPVTITASQLAASANPIVASEGVPTVPGLAVGTIYAPGAANAAALNAVFNWGDGTLFTTGGGGLTVVPLGAGNYSVLANPHTYAAFGTYSTTLGVQEIGGGNATSSNVAAVSNGTLTGTPGAGPFTAQEGTAYTFAAGNPVMTFTDTNLGATAGQFTALIHWGDGQTSVGTVTATGPGAFRVTGAHTYLKDGNFTIYAEVEDNGGAKTGATVPFVATSATYTGTALPINAVQNSPLINVEVATFTSSNGFDTADRFYATINWGDGTPLTAGFVVQDATANPPTFHVIGSHTYTTAGAFTRTITIAKGDPVVILTLGGGGGGGGGGSVTVGSSPISSTAVNVNGIEGMALPNVQAIAGGTIVATFTDPGTTEPLSSYTASINWGNGQITNGTVLLNGGTYFVIAPPTPDIIYPNVGSTTFLVTITKTVAAPPGVFQSFAVGTANIVNAALVATNGGPFNVVEGQPLTASPLITFTDQDTTSNPANFTVSINWGDGTPATGGTITEPTPGNFQVAGTHTYTQNGVYTVTVTVTDDAGLSVSATATVTATQAAITPNAVDLQINAVQNSQLVDVAVATFTSANPFDTAGQFSATIAWGDGTTTAGTVIQDAAGVFHVIGTHTYATPGPFFVQTEVSETDTGIVIPMNQSAVVTVAPSPLTITPAGVNGIEGVALPNAGTVIGGTIVATFTDGGAAAPPLSYSAQIDFGGAIGVRPGTIVQNGSNFTVLLGGAPVIFPDVGSSNFTVTVTKTGGFLAYGVGSVTIANAALAPLNNGTPFTVVEGQPLTTSPLVGFTDQDTTSGIADFTATINWGDGTQTTAGIITEPTPGNFQVAGAHTYTKNGTYNVVVTITDDAGQTITATATVNATQAAMTTGPVIAINALQNSPLVNIDVATFTSANGFDVASQFVATINWGDGSVTSGVVQQDSAGVFHVTGSHTYALAGAFNVTVQVAEGDPVVVIPTYLSATVNVAATPLLVLPVQVNGIEGIALPNAQNATNGTVVATFLDLGAAAPLVNYTAQIIWGNGVTSPGTVLQDGPNFVVVAPPGVPIVYTDMGNYSIRVTVTKQTGAGSFIAYGIGTAAIDNAALTSVVAAPVNAFQQTPLLNVEVGRFLDANPLAQLSEYSAMIAWGDGTPMSAATFSQPGGPGTVVIVQGSHTYANPTTGGNPYVITVFLEDDDGARLRLDNTATVAASALVGTPVTISGIENQTFANVVVAYFRDTATTPSPLSSYAATINWGETPPTPNSIGQIVHLGGNDFAVLGTKTYPNAGNYAVTVTVTRNSLPGVTIVSNAVIADAPINGTALPIFPIEGANFTGNVAFFTSANPADPATDFTALITWGDGTTSTGTVVPNGSGYRVTAVDPGSGLGKRYQDEGLYTYSVRVTSIDGATFISYETATVMDAPLTATGITTTIPEWPAFNGIIATFSDANPFALATTPEHVATINWGDGVTSTGTIAQLFSPMLAPTQFTVSGTHLYEPGVYQVTITIQDEGGSRAIALSTITVTDSPLTAGPAITITSQEGQPVTAQVATFTDANPLGQIGEFSATINWGDGSPVSSAIIGQTAAGVFTVTGTHTYAAFTTAPLPVTVTIRSIDGATATVNSSAIVLNAPLASEGSTIRGTEGNTTGNVIVATFQDENPNSNISHFTSGGGVITVSWGDGTPDTTVLAANVTSVGGANGVTYTVRAAHTYANVGVYQVTTTIRDNGGATTVANGQAVIDDAPLTTTGLTQPTISGVEGQTFSGPVFTFNDGNPLSTPADFTAEVNWGNGQVVAGVITQPGGPGTPYVVTSTHFFDDSGTYLLGVVVTDVDGSTIGRTTPYVVTNVAPTAVISNNGPVNENSPVTVTLSDPMDPSPVDRTAGFRYSFSLTTGGLATSYLGASPNNSAQFTLPDGLVPPVGTTIFGRIFDKDGGFTDYNTSVTVLNVAPTATFSVATPLIPGQPSLVSFTNQFDPSPVDTAAGFRYSYDLGTGVFGPLTTSSTATFIPPGPGTYVIRGRIFDKDGSVSNGSFTEYIAGQPGGVVVVPNVDIFVLGAGVDGGPMVHVHSAQTYERIGGFTAYEPTFRGGVLVGVGDVTGDGIPDIITGTGNGGGPVVKVFSGPLYAEVVSFFAYESTFRGGVLVATADIDGDGRDEIVTGTGIGGGPVVKVFSFNPSGSVTERSSFYAYNPDARGGVFVAGGNSTGAPRDAAGRAVEEIITGAGAGGGPHVKVFSAAGTEFASFFAYEPSVMGGVTVSAGDLYGTGFDNIVTGTGASGGPSLKIWGPLGLPLFANFAAFGPDKITGEPLRNGFNVSAKHIGGPNGRPILIAGAGRDYGPTVRVFDAVTLDAIVEILPFEKEFTGGVYVG